MQCACKTGFPKIVCGCYLCLFFWVCALSAAGDTPALQTLRTQAESGNKHAQFHLANRYFYGKEDCPVNRDLAVYWYRKSAEQGVPEAQYNYALCLEQGIGIGRNIPEALKYYRLASAQEFLPAMYRQAVLLLHGPGISATDEKKSSAADREALQKIMNPEAGLVILEQLAEKHQMPDAQIDLAEYLMKHLPQDSGKKIKEGKRIYALLTRAEKQKAVTNQAKIWRLLADCFFGGHGVPVNEKKAVEFLNKAVDAGDDEALVKLAYCVEKGVAAPPDSQKAFALYRQGAMKGFPYAQYKYGGYIAMGCEKGKGLNEAIRWYQRAANYQCPEALHQMGILYHKGIGVDRNEAMAAECIMRAAKLDYAPAQLALAKLFLKGGKVVKADPSASVYWFDKAAEKGSAQACKYLALCRFYGTGCSMDANAARKAMQNAAMLGDPQAAEWIQVNPHSWPRITHLDLEL